MNYYRKIMKALLTETDIDYKSLVVEIACHNPKVVHDALVRQQSDGWRGQVKALVEGEQKVAAIKLWRQYTGDSLVDSKKAVESL